MVPCLISNLFRLLIAPIIFFIGVCIPSLSDAFGCYLFEHIEENLLIIFFPSYLILLRISISYFKYHQMLTFTPTFNIHESTIELTLFSLPNVSGNA